MSRIWTARKQTTFHDGAVPEDGVPPYPISRAELVPVAAAKRALGLFAVYALLFLPLHLFVCFLSARAPSLTTALVLIATAGLLAVAIARSLALDDLLQQLPVLAVLALAGIGIVVLTSQWMPRAFGKGDFIGSIFVLVIVTSLLSSFYKPLAVAYQTVTQKTPVRDLFAVAGALLTSLALALAAHALPRFALWPVAGLMCGSLSGLILTEYAAWARANPWMGLERLIDFEAGDELRKRLDPRWAVIGASIFGLAFGLISAVNENLRTPGGEFARVVFALSSEPTLARTMLAQALIIGLMGMVFGFIVLGRSLGAVIPGNPFRALRYAGQAALVFLCYPDVKHPLVHRMRIKAVRSRAVRGVLAGLTLLTVTTALSTPADKSKQSEEAVAKQAPPREAVSLQPEHLWPAVEPPELWAMPGQHAPIPHQPLPASPPAQPAASEEGMNVLGLFDRFLGYVVAPFLFFASVLFFLGLAVLPTYGDYFEPRPSSP